MSLSQYYYIIFLGSFRKYKYTRYLNHVCLTLLSKSDIDVAWHFNVQKRKLIFAGAGDWQIKNIFEEQIYWTASTKFGNNVHRDQQSDELNISINIDFGVTFGVTIFWQDQNHKNCTFCATYHHKILTYSTHEFMNLFFCENDSITIIPKKLFCCFCVSKVSGAKILRVRQQINNTTTWCLHSAAPSSLYCIRQKENQVVTTQSSTYIHGMGLG